MISENEASDLFLDKSIHGSSSLIQVSDFNKILINSLITY